MSSREIAQFYEILINLTPDMLSGVYEVAQYLSSECLEVLTVFHYLENDLDLDDCKEVKKDKIVVILEAITIQRNI